jgi:hypothetical protein
METFEQFVERMEKVERRDLLQVGSRHQGNFREIYEYEGQTCYHEAFNFMTDSYIKNRSVPERVICMRAAHCIPWYRWTHGYCFYGKKRIKMLMKHYGASAYDEEPYAEKEGVWFYLIFKGDDDFNKLMRLVYDIHTGEFKRLFGDEEEKFRCSI